MYARRVDAFRMHQNERLGAAIPQTRSGHRDTAVATLTIPVYDNPEGAGLLVVRIGQRDRFATAPPQERARGLVALAVARPDDVQSRHAVGERRGKSRSGQNGAGGRAVANGPRGVPL
jgi:hypothetical protein